MSPVLSTEGKCHNTIDTSTEDCNNSSPASVHTPPCSRKKDVRLSIDQLLEGLHKKIIRNNVWVQLEGSHNHRLPAFSQPACQVVASVIESAIQRHRVQQTVAYVKIGFSTQGAKTTITVEDNAESPSLNDVESLGFLRDCRSRTLSGGYTAQAVLRDTLGEVSVRCVNHCFTRFSIAFYH